MLVAAEFDDGSKMDDTELRDQLVTLLLAGHETTATGLAWTFDLLLHRPDAHERLVEEVNAGEREYLDAVIEESLRVRPVVPFTGRELRGPMTLGGYDFEAGDVVMSRDLPDPDPRGHLPGAVRVPPRALPRRLAAGELLVDPVRRRHAALHRRRLRADGDADRDRDDPPLGRAPRRFAASSSGRSAATSPRLPAAERG